MEGQAIGVEMAQGAVQSVATGQVSDVESLPSAGAEPDVESMPGPAPRLSVKHPGRCLSEPSWCDGA